MQKGLKKKICFEDKVQDKSLASNFTWKGKAVAKLLGKQMKGMTVVDIELFFEKFVDFTVELGLSVWLLFGSFKVI